MKPRLLPLLLAVAAPSFAGCHSSPHLYDPEMFPSGLVVQELVVPQGPVAEPGDRVSIHYHGTLEDGSVFDSSVERGLPVEFTLGEADVSPVFDQGVAGMHLFGRRKLSAPAEVVFPAGVPPDIASHAQLHFEVELLELAKTPRND